MSDTKRGVINKFVVRRTDGKSGKGQKHENCRYFVLDLDHDKFAAAALLAYAAACQDEYPQLAVDLRGGVAEVSRKIDADKARATEAEMDRRYNQW